METTASLIVAFICIAAGFTGLQFVRDVGERRLLMHLFFAAFALRLVFTFLCYKTGLVDVLGGKDDLAWKYMWAKSRIWESTGHDSLWSVYGPMARRNSGYQYFGTYFFYLLDMRSQMALAVLNCFLNSLTVLVIYNLSRKFFSARAGLLAAGAAIIMPGFLIWSALTIKESWLILFEITTLFAVLKLRDSRNVLSIVLYSIFILLLLLLIFGFRFYLIGFLVAGIITSLLCIRSRKPFRSAAIGIGSIALCYIVLHQAHIVQFDLTSIVQDRYEELNTFRDNISDYSKSGTGSAIEFGYDTRTVGGTTLMVLTGGVYLLLSPFPWDIWGSTRQLAALPDVVLWWVLVFGFIFPGIRYVRKQQPGLLVSLVAFVLPLFLFYSLMFGNIGLAYRQRAQLMPFLLLLAAAGYQERQRKVILVSEKKKFLLIKLLRLRSQAILQQMGGTAAPE